MQDTAVLNRASSRRVGLATDLTTNVILHDLVNWEEPEKAADRPEDHCNDYMSHKS